MAEFRQPHHTDPTHLVWSPDGKLLAVTDRYGDTVIYNIDDASDTKFISRDETKMVFSMAFHPTANHIALAHSSGVIIYDLADTKLIWKVNTPQPKPSDISFTQDGREVLSDAYHKKVEHAKNTHQHKVLSPQPVWKFDTADYMPFDVAYSQDGNLLFVACWHEEEDAYGTDGALFVYDTITRKLAHQHIENQALVMKLAVDHDNQQFAWSGNDGIVRLCDMQTFQQTATFEPFKVNSPAVSFVKFLGHDALYIECEDDYGYESCLWQPSTDQSHTLKNISDLKNFHDQFYAHPLTIVRYGNHPYRYLVHDVHAPDEVVYACRGSQGGGANVFSYLAVHTPSKRTAWADASYQSYEKDIPRNRLSIYDWEKRTIIIQYGDDNLDKVDYQESIAPE